MTHRLPPQSPKNPTSMLQPPFHFHIHQTEHFSLRSGTAHFYLGLSPLPFTTLSLLPSAPKTAFIPAGHYHRFKNASDTEELVIDIQLSPEAYEDEQRFFRNFFGYLEDCRKGRVEPSLFQLLVFLHAADTPLAVPVPWLLGGELAGRLVSRVILVVGAVWGRWVLGYRGSYGEYYEEGKGR